MMPLLTKPYGPVKYPVGALVRVQFGHQVLRARIVENRGPLGIGGRNIVRIQVVNTSIENDEPFEVAEDDIIAPKKAKARKAKARAK